VGITDGGNSTGEIKKCIGWLVSVPSSKIATHHHQLEVSFLVKKCKLWKGFIIVSYSACQDAVGRPSPLGVLTFKNLLISEDLLVIEDAGVATLDPVFFVAFSAHLSSDCLSFDFPVII